MTTWITICDTCKRIGWEKTGMEKTDGEALAEMVEVASTGVVDVKPAVCLAPWDATAPATSQCRPAAR